MQRSKLRLGPVIYFVFFIYLSTLISCTDNDTRYGKYVDPDAIFFDYKIKGEEKDSLITVYLQFRRGGPNGSTIMLSGPANVELDGEIIPIDSAKLTGAFYEIQKPAKGFAGKHTILFTDFNKKEYEQEFVYRPFTLKTKIPDTVRRGNLTFEFNGLESEDYIRVSLVDTSFRNRDINEIDTVKNGKLIVSAEKLKNLVDGPITVLLYKDVERPVQKSTKAGGRISVTYGFTREFELKSPLKSS